MVNTKKIELIQELRELRKQKELSYQQIADITEEHGEAVSLSTIKAVFSSKHIHDHDYNNVLRPIANALSSPNENDTLEVRVLQTRLELKEEIIKQLEDRIARKDQRYKDQEALLVEQLDFYKDQIKFKDDQIKRYEQNIDRKDVILRKYLLEE